MIDIKTQIFNTYVEYVSLGYPQDHEVYEVRANPHTVIKLVHVSQDAKMPGSHLLKGDRFLMFRLKSDSRLKPGDIFFGPETTELKWSE